MKHTALFSLIIFSAVLPSCTTDEPMVSLGIDNNYSIYRMKPLILTPRYPGKAYVWSVPDSHGGDSVVSTEAFLYFVRRDPGDYTVKLNIVDDANPVEHIVNIKVWDEDVAYSRYIDRVLDYAPAPGQFVNKLPEYAPGDDAEAMRVKAEECIRGRNDVMISLGGFGGSVVFAFDHTVVNVPGEYDFKIYGNAFYASGTQTGGSAEPGIVMVSCDINGNGKADDPWYELAGSEYYSEATAHDMTITYTRPADDGDVAWTLGNGDTGCVPKNAYHSQPYFPQWLDKDVMSFTGTLLAPNAIDHSGNGTNYVLYAYAWGYVDNHPNDAGDLSKFKIDWAVDSQGKPVHLDGVDFIKVYTGVNQVCGWLGETSTEICRAEDLHVLNDK